MLFVVWIGIDNSLPLESALSNQMTASIKPCKVSSCADNTDISVQCEYIYCCSKCLFQYQFGTKWRRRILRGELMSLCSNTAVIGHISITESFCF
jgi:hypothetical protein